MLENQVAQLIGRSEAFEKMLLSLIGGVPTHVEAPGATGALARLTTKQHAALQMLIAGKGNKDIAERFGVTDNGAKVYVRAIAKKAGVNTRSQILMTVYDEWNGIGAEQYKAISGGLPKDWAEKFLGSDVKDDPYAKLYIYERHED